MAGVRDAALLWVVGVGGDFREDVNGGRDASSLEGLTPSGTIASHGVGSRMRMNDDH